MYDLNIAFTNKCFQFKSYWLKKCLQDTIARNFAGYHCVKEIKNFEHLNLSGDMHQNLMSDKLYLGATESKSSRISEELFLETQCPQNFGNIQTDKSTYRQTDIIL